MLWQKTSSLKGTTVWLSLLLFGHIAFAKPPSKNYQTAYKYAWQLRLNDAVKVPLDKLEREHIIGITSFLHGYISDGDVPYKQSIDNISNVLSTLQGEDDPFSQTATAELYILQASLKAKHGSRMSAAFDFWKGYRRAKSNAINYPNYPPAQLHWGIIECGLGSMPEHLQQYLSWIGFSGDLDEGLQRLNACYKKTKQNSDWEHLSILTGLAYVSTEVQLNNNAHIDLCYIGLDPLISPITVAVEAKLLFDKSDAYSAYNLIEKHQYHPNAQPFPYLTYTTGRIAVTLGKTNAADILKTYIKQTQGDFFVASAHRYLWWHYTRLDNTEKATHHRNLINSTKRDNTLTGADQLAVYEAQYPLNIHLLDARLLYDRGDFSKCIRHLTSKMSNEVCTNDRERGEYFYRLGRCHQNLKQFKEALVRLDQSITFYGEMETFERANALIQAGAICEASNQCERGIEYYKEALTFSNYPFVEGLHQKAKSGIKRCK